MHSIREYIWNLPQPYTYTNSLTLPPIHPSICLFHTINVRSPPQITNRIKHKHISKHMKSTFFWILHFKCHGFFFHDYQLFLSLSSILILLSKLAYQFSIFFNYSYNGITFVIVYSSLASASLHCISILHFNSILSILAINSSSFSFKVLFFSITLISTSFYHLKIPQSLFT